MKPLSRKLELATYAHDKVVTFRFIRPSTNETQPHNEVLVPVPLMYRLYHLGRAYDLHQLIALQPKGKSVIDFVSLQFLISELEQLTVLLNDPVIHHYAAELLSIFKGARQETKDMVIVEEA
jgi:hypothetical protein